MLKPMAVYWRSVLTLKVWIQPKWDQVLKALVGAKDYFVSHTGKVLVFDEETKKISRALADLRAKMSKGGKLQARRIAAYQLSDLLADQDNVHFQKTFEI